MKLCILESQEMHLCRPNNIKVLFDAGHLDLIIDTAKKIYKHGNHVLLEGSQESFLEWLRPFQQVWVGEPNTPMQAQQFALLNVKKA